MPGLRARRATRCGSVTCPIDSLDSLGWGYPFDLGCPWTCLLLLCWALTSGPTETSGASCAFALRRLPPAGSGRPQRLGSLRERICSCGSPDVGVGKFRDPVRSCTINESRVNQFHREAEFNSRRHRILLVRSMSSTNRRYIHMHRPRLRPLHNRA